MATPREVLGKRIKQKREELGISQSELAQSIGKVSAAYIAFVEAGQRNINTTDLMLIAKELATTVADLVGEPSSQEKPQVIKVLRASKDLAPDDRKKVEEYYSLLKKKKK